METLTTDAQQAERQIIKAAFGTLPDEELAYLLHDDRIVDTFARARSVLTNIERQFVAYKAAEAAGKPVDREWRRRALVVRRQVLKLCDQLRPRAADRNRRVNPDVGRLGRAILAHRAAILAEHDPTPADVKLWSSLETDKP